MSTVGRGGLCIIVSACYAAAPAVAAVRLVTVPHSMKAAGAPCALQRLHVYVHASSTWDAANHAGRLMQKPRLLPELH